MAPVQKIVHIKISSNGMEGEKFNTNRMVNSEVLRDKAVSRILREPDCIENEDCGEGAVHKCLISRSLMSFSLRNVFSVENPLSNYYLCVT